MMADTDRYERIASTYAAEMREAADRLDEVRRKLGMVPPSPVAWLTVLELADTATFALREKADALDDLPTIAQLWIDNEEH